MPADTLTETVVVGREALADLLAEAVAVVDVIEELVPAGAESLARELDRKANTFAALILQDADGIWRDGEDRARRALAALAEDLQARIAEAPPTIQLLAAEIAYRELERTRVATELGLHEEDGDDG